MTDPEPSSEAPRRRRVRYAGTHPRRFHEKYKEHAPAQYPEAVAHILASGKTPAGMHRPIMVAEILAVLQPQPGALAVDCTLGYGGHAQEILAQIKSGGKLIGLDVDPLQLPLTEQRLRTLGYGPEVFEAQRTNYAALPQVIASTGRKADLLLADLGVSSMQYDNPARGFSYKVDGPLDMRMNPRKGVPASTLLEQTSAEKLEGLLSENADEPAASILASVLAGRRFSSTLELARAIRTALSRVPAKEADLSVRRVFQALRIAVNDEFAALETFLRALPESLAPGARVAILTFHSGEDRRVKDAFKRELVAGVYAEISREVIRATPEEQRANPRSTSAKLRWARRSG